MAGLLDEGIRLEMIDLGGGFPARYLAGVPSIGEVGAIVLSAVAELLPYRPGLLVAEPGRLHRGPVPVPAGPAGVVSEFSWGAHSQNG